LLLWLNLQVGVELKFKDAGYKHMAAVTHVPELSEVSSAPHQRQQ